MAHAVNNHREAELMQQDSQQRRQVGLFTRAVIAGDHNWHRFADRRRQLNGVLLHRFIEALHLRFTFALDAQGNKNAAELKVRHLAVKHPRVERAGRLHLQVAGVVFSAPDFFNNLAVVHCRLL